MSWLFKKSPSASPPLETRLVRGRKARRQVCFHCRIRRRRDTDLGSGAKRSLSASSDVSEVSGISVSTANHWSNCAVLVLLCFLGHVSQESHATTCSCLFSGPVSRVPSGRKTRFIPVFLLLFFRHIFKRVCGQVFYSPIRK